jgi:hypothetical protein
MQVEPTRILFTLPVILESSETKLKTAFQVVLDVGSRPGPGDRGQVPNLKLGLTKGLKVECVEPSCGADDQLLSDLSERLPSAVVTFEEGEFFEQVSSARLLTGMVRAYNTLVDSYA